VLVYSKRGNREERKSDREEKKKPDSFLVLQYPV